MNVFAVGAEGELVGTLEDIGNKMGRAVLALAGEAVLNRLELLKGDLRNRSRTYVRLDMAPVVA